jgi:hypothetical protein
LSDVEAVVEFDPAVCPKPALGETQSMNATQARQSGGIHFSPISSLRSCMMPCPWAHNNPNQ